jgi:hypothetical protein
MNQVMDESNPKRQGAAFTLVELLVLTIDTRARPPELVEAFVVARSDPRGS